jgi:hypothetical protein
LGASSIDAQTTLISDTIQRKNEVVVYGKGLPFALSDRTSTIQTFDISRNGALPIRSVNEALAYGAPSYTELVYQDYSNVGNPNLQPEYATNAEIGASYAITWGQSVSGSRDSWKSILTLDAAVYRRNTTNMIDWVRSTTTP